MSEAHDGAPEGVTEDTTVADDLIDTANPVEQPGDDAAAAAEAEGEGEKPKPKPTAQERIDELTKARRDAEREAAHWKRIASDGAPKPEPKAEDKPQGPVRPSAADYEFGETDPAFIEALGSYAAEKRFSELEQQREQRNHARTVEQSWTERQETFAKDKPDYFEVRDRKWDCSQPMADAIRTSDLGAQVAYHLASNPEEARRIAGMNPLAAIREIGRLEARFDTKAVAPIKPASDAPAPPQQVRGNGGRFAADPATTDFAQFEKLADAKG